MSTRLATEPLDKLPDGSIRFPVTNWDLFNTVDIAPRQPSNPPREFFEFFPPLLRDPLDPNILIALDDFPPFEWVPEPLQRIDNPWVPWLFLPEPVTGPQGGMAIRPAWGPRNAAGQRTPVELTADNKFIVVHEIDRKTGLEKPNVINLRLNRGTGQLDIIPRNQGIYQVSAYVENILGMSQPKPIQITVALPNYNDWKDIWWDAQAFCTPRSASGRIAPRSSSMRKSSLPKLSPVASQSNP